MRTTIRVSDHLFHDSYITVHVPAITNPNVRIGTYESWFAYPLPATTIHGSRIQIRVFQTYES